MRTSLQDTTEWTDINDGTKARVQITLDHTRLGHIVARARVNKTGRATAAHGAIIITVIWDEREERRARKAWDTNAP